MEKVCRVTQCLGPRAVSSPKARVTPMRRGKQEQTSTVPRRPKREKKWQRNKMKTRNKEGRNELN